ncbi:PD-(D/E)XK nuclease family protein [Chloroflexota bacterium]
MTAQLHIAPPAAGKTQFAIEHLRGVLKDSPLATAWVIVPDRLQAAAFRRRLSSAGGAIGAHVGTFGDLYKEVLELAGNPIPVASDPTIYFLIRSIVEDLHKQGRLPHYSSIRNTPGFINGLKEHFAEFKRALLWPEKLVTLTLAGEPGLAELAQLYLSYQQKLQSIDWADPEGLSWLAVEALESQPDLLNTWRLVIVDGFDDFNRTQRKALRLLADRIPEVIITLPGTAEMRRSVHGRFMHALDDLIADINPEIHYLDSSPHLPAPLSTLESQVFEKGTTPKVHNDRIFLLEVKSPAEEVREALRWIKARIQRWHISPNDCAIFVQQVDTYYPYLKEAAAEFGLPLRITWGEPLVQSPAIAALLGLLKLPIQNYPQRLTLETIRSPYFDLSEIGLTQKDADLLELVSIKWQVVAGLEQWFSAFEGLTLTSPTPQNNAQSEEDLEPYQPSLPGGDSAARLEAAFRTLVHRLKVTDPKVLNGWISWLEDLLDEIDFIQRCEPEVLEALRDILRALALSETVAGSQVNDYQQFINSLQSAIEGSVYNLNDTLTRTSILVGRMIEARGIRFKAVAILGLSEGIFPEIERPDPFIDEANRAQLGLDSRIGRHQSSLFYQAITRADEALLLSRPYLAEGGEPWEPSYYWNEVNNIFPEACVRIKSDAPRSLHQACSRQEALFWAVRQGAVPQTDQKLIAQAQYVEYARQILQDRLGEKSKSRYEGDLSELSSEFSELYGPEHVWSASRLETYGNCPHQFFAANVLNLEAKEFPELGFDASQLGTMLHAILEEVYQYAEDPNDLESVLDALPGIASEKFASAPEEYGFRPNVLWEEQQEAFIARLEKTVIELVKKSAGWTPIGYELAYGFWDKKAPALEIDTQIGRIKLHGFIDRVDRNTDGNLRIIDYKTGSSHLSKGDLIDGRRLQLPLYTLATSQSLNLGKPIDGFYWGINSAKGYLFLNKFKHDSGTGPEAAIDIACKHVERIVKEIRSARFPPVPPSGGCPKWCPASAWCWRYEPGFYR